jgi:hypothetical protein
MFGKKTTFDDPLLGPISWSQEHWTTRALPTSEGEVTVMMEGSRSGPSPGALERARSVLTQPTPAVTAAKAFVIADPDASEFCLGNGQLVLDGFTVSVEGELRVELALSEWPDAMITVVFTGETPCKTLLAD